MLHHGSRDVWRTGWAAWAAKRPLRCATTSQLFLSSPSIIIREHPEVGENQSNQLAEENVNIVKAVIRTLKSSTGSNFGVEARIIR